MAINNYTLATKPYTRGFGDKTTTVVEIRLQDGNRYTTNQRELAGDRTQDQEDVLIQAVLDMVKSELDPANDLESTKTKQDELQKLIKAQQEANTITQRMIRVIVVNSVMSENITYGTVYKDLVSLLPAMRVGETYFEGDLVTITDPGYVEKNGEGNNVIVQMNREFAYTGQTIQELEGDLSRNGILAVWRWVAPKADHI